MASFPREHAANNVIFVLEIKPAWDLFKIMMIY